MVGVTIVAAWNGLCAVPQWLMGRRVYYSSAQLREAKPVDGDDGEDDVGGDQENPQSSSSSSSSHEPKGNPTADGGVTTSSSSGAAPQPQQPHRSKKQSLCMKLSRFSRHHAFWPVLGYCFHYFSVLNSGVLMVGYVGTAHTLSGSS